ATPWNPQLGGPGYVDALAARGNTLYVGGVFFGAGNTGSNYLTAVDLRTGAASSWDPRPNGYIVALAVQGDVLYVSGYMSSIWNWQRRTGIAALDASTGAPTGWNVHAEGVIVEALAVHDGIIYAGGLFNVMGGQPRSN